MAGKHRSSQVPPDGGWGWVVVIGSNISFQVALVIRCMGVFFNEWKDAFNASATAVGMVGSVHMGAFLFMGPLAGYLCHRIGSRKLAILGGVIAFTSLLVASFAKSLLHIILSFGVFGGLGCGFAFISAVTIITKYFKKRYATAHSIANSGGALATIVLPLLARFLIDLYTWNKALFILAALSSNLCVCGMLFRPVQPRRRELSDEEPQLCEDTEEVSAQDRVLNRSLTGSHGHGYRKISSTSDGKPGESEETDVNVIGTPDKKHSRKTSASPGLQSELEDIVKTNNRTPDRKPRKKVSVCPVDIAEPESAVNSKDISDGLHQRKLSETCGCSSNLLECSDASPSGDKLNGVSVKNSARLEQRRPTTASVYLKHISRGSGLFLLQTKFRFTNFCIVQSVQNIAFAAISIHFVPMTIEAGISKLDAALLMSIYGVGSLLGRLCTGPLIDRKILSPLKMYFSAVLTSGVFMIICPNLHTFAGYIVFAIVVGAMTGVFKALTAITIRGFVGSDLMPLAMGIFMPFVGIGMVIGPTLAGWLYDVREKYDLAFYITGSMLVLSCFPLLLMPYLRRLENRCGHGAEASDEMDEKPAVPQAVGSLQSLNAI